MAAAATSPLPEPETLFPSSLSRRSLAQWSYVAVGLGLVAALGAMARGTSDPKLAKGKLGAVATASPEASAAALEILERGGNAADALVAASFAVSVTRPQSTGLGGGGFAVFFNQARREAAALDFRETAPLGGDPSGVWERPPELCGARRARHSTGARWLQGGRWIGLGERRLRRGAEEVAGCGGGLFARRRALEGRAAARAAGARGDLRAHREGWGR
jgi:hypothetical protein